MSVKNDPSARHPDKKNGMQRRLNLTQRRKDGKNAQSIVHGRGKMPRLRDTGLFSKLA